MNRPALIKAACYAVLAMGDTPSQRTVQAMLKRICGKKLHTGDVLQALVALRLQGRSGPVAVAPRKSPDLVAPGLQAGSSRARVVKDLSNKKLESAYALSPQRQMPLLDAPTVLKPRERGPRPAAAPPAPRAAAFAAKPRSRQRTAAQITADAALEAIRVRVEPLLGGMTITGWKQRNRCVATEMAASGMTAAEIDAAHVEHSEQRGRVTIMLQYVQRDLASRPPVEQERFIEDVLPPDELSALRAKIIAKIEARQAEEAAQFGAAR